MKEAGLDQLGQRLAVQRLFLGLHHFRQLHVARLVQAQVGGEHGRQVDVDHLESGVHLARDAGRATVDLDGGGEGRLRA